MKYSAFLLALGMAACARNEVDMDGADSVCIEVGNADCRDYQSEMCAKRSPESCHELSYCAAIGGTKLDDERACFGESEIVGCAPIGCTAKITYASHGGETWKFPSGCIPSGWSEVPAVNADPCSTSGCEALSADTCEASGSQCALYRAYAVDEQKQCVGSEFAPKGCHPVGCGARQTLATDPDGRLGISWIRASLPVGRRKATVPYRRAPAQGAPRRSPQGAIRSSLLLLRSAWKPHARTNHVELPVPSTTRTVASRRAHGTRTVPPGKCASIDSTRP